MKYYAAFSQCNRIYRTSVITFGTRTWPIAHIEFMMHFQDIASEL